MNSAKAVPSSAADSARVRGLPQAIAAIVATAFVFVGLAGFVPGLTTEYGQMTIAGQQSTALLVGLFRVSILLNLVHLAFGVAGFVVARSVRASLWFLLGGGFAYVGLALYGAVIGRGSAANLLPVNVADNWLHVGLGAAMIVLGVVGRTLAERATAGIQTAADRPADRPAAG